MKRLALFLGLLAAAGAALAQGYPQLVGGRDPAGTAHVLLTDTSGNVQTTHAATAVCNKFAAINQTASGQAITGVAGQHIYICAISIITATAQSVSIVEGTGTVCGTGTTAILGGTTASAALVAAENIHLGAAAPLLVTATAGDNLCVLQSGTGNISGMISYTTAP